MLNPAPTAPRDAADLLTYERDGDAIYAESFATIRREADLNRFDADTAQVAVRMIHACGDITLASDIDAAPGVVAAARTALDAGAAIFTDAHMVAEGITRRRLPSANGIITTLRDPRTPGLAREAGTTRSAAAVDLWLPRLQGSIVAIGNAPTALFRLLELLRDGAPRPAAIIGIPVGFVGAQESKHALAHLAPTWGVPHLTVHGRRGGSAITSAAVNAVATHHEIMPTTGSTTEAPAGARA